MEDSFGSGGYEVCGLLGGAEVLADLLGGSGVEVAEAYRFPRPSLALLLPDRKTGALSAEQLQVADTLLQTRFVASGSDMLAERVHVDVKTSIVLQRYAALHLGSREVRMAEEKFTIEDQPPGDIERLYNGFKNRANAQAKAVASARDQYDNNCSDLFMQTEAGDY